MKVGIIVPVYNAEKYITDCFLSIANQTYKNIEAIFVDDCSTDNSYKILRELKERHEKNSEIQYKIIRHEKNGGVHLARNTGIYEALREGEGYILFSDNDDIIAPNCIEHLLSFAEKYPNAEIIQGGTIFLDENTFVQLLQAIDIIQDWNVIYELITANMGESLNQTRIFHGKDILRFWLQYSLRPELNIIPCGVWASLYRADFIEKNIIFFAEDLPISEDVWFRYLCFKYATQIVINNTLIHFYRVREDSYSHSQDKRYLQIKCSAACFEKMLPDIDNKEFSRALAEWGIKALNSGLNKMKTEKEKTLFPRYLDVLKKLKEKLRTIDRTRIP